MATTPYGMQALSGELTKLARAVQGDRNNTLNGVWFKLCQLIPTYLDHNYAYQQVYDTARQIGLPDSEIRKTMASARSGGQAKPRENIPTPIPPAAPAAPPPPGYGGFLQPGTAPDIPTSTPTPPAAPPTALPDTFWAARPALAHIRQAAHSRGRSAEAVLGAVLARIAADTGHVVKLPAVVGARCGLSLIVALTGPPGSGKSSSKSIATELAPAQILKPDCDDIPPGSGEGLIEILFERVPEGDDGKMAKRQTRHNAFVYVDEGEILAVQARRNTANTILPIIRSVFTDGTLGQANASEDRKRRVKGGHYVYGIVLGIQPEKAGALFEDAGGGTPQRFLWMPTDTPVPAPGARPEWPGELPRPRPDYGGQLSSWKYIGIPDQVRAEVQARDHDRQEHGCDPLDQHLDLVRLKVAATLAVLDGRLNLTIEDWQLAEAVVITSTLARDRARATIARQAREANQARGEAEAGRQIIVDDKRDEVAIEKVRAAIVGKLAAANGQGVARGPLYRTVPHKYRRDYFDYVIDHLKAERVIESEPIPGRGRGGMQYRLGKGSDS